MGKRDAEGARGGHFPRDNRKRWRLFPRDRELSVGRRRAIPEQEYRNAPGNGNIASPVSVLADVPDPERLIDSRAPVWRIVTRTCTITGRMYFAPLPSVFVARCQSTR